MITFVGGYIIGMGMAFVAMMFFGGVKQANQEYDAQQVRVVEAARMPARPTRARRKAAAMNTALSGRASA